MAEWRRADLVAAMGPQATEVYVAGLSITREQGTVMGKEIELELEDVGDAIAEAQQRAWKAASERTDDPLPIDVLEFERYLRQRLIGLRVPSRVAADCSAEIAGALLGYAMCHNDALSDDDRDILVAVWERVMRRRR